MRAVVGQDSTGELSWPLVDRRQSRNDPPSGIERRQRVDQDHIEKLSSANQVLLALQKIAITLPSSFDLEKVLDQGVSQVQDLVGADIVTILLADADSSQFNIVRGRGSAKHVAVKIEQIPAHIIQAVSVNRTVTAELSKDSPGFAIEATTGAYCALRSRGIIVGLVAAEWRIARNVVQETQILTGIADALGVAIDNASIFKDIRRQSASDERLRIARDLHDRTGSTLAFIGMEVDRLIRGTQDQSLLSELTNVREHVSTTITEIREMLYDLRSGQDGRKSLSETVKDFAERIMSRSPINVIYEFSFPTIANSYLSHEMWEMIKESLLNAERHSRCTEILIRTIPDVREWVVAISDNGVGIPENRNRDDSYGITGLFERAENTGASVEITSPLAHRDFGTEVRISIPFAHLQNDDREVS